MRTTFGARVLAMWLFWMGLLILAHAPEPVIGEPRTTGMVVWWMLNRLWVASLFAIAVKELIGGAIPKPTKTGGPNA